MKRSGYLAKKAIRDQVYETAAVRIEKQFLLDTMQIALHEFGFGYRRIMELTVLWKEVYDRYHPALEGGPESDVWQEKLDGEILDILKGQQELIPFPQRYEYVRRCGYDKPMRGVEPIAYKGGTGK